MNQAPSLFLYFLFNYLQAVQVLLYFPSPYATLSFCFFGFFLILNCAFGLSPIPFSSVRAPHSARICCLCNLCCAHMLALPAPPATPCSTECPFSSLQPFCQRLREPARNGAILPWPLLPFPCCRLLSSDQGEAVLLPSHSTGRHSPAAA